MSENTSFIRKSSMFNPPTKSLSQLKGHNPFDEKSEILSGYKDSMTKWGHQNSFIVCLDRPQQGIKYKYYA